MYAANRSFALGADVPTAHGTFPATTSPPYCGSPFALQQMLADLGFYSGPVNGKIDAATLKAAADFARSRGVTKLSHVTPEFCRLLTGDWEKLQAAALVTRPAPPATTFAPPPNGVPAAETPATPPVSLAPSGWAALDDTTKYAIAGAAALGLAGLVVLVVVGKKGKKR